MQRMRVRDRFALIPRMALVAILGALPAGCGEADEAGPTPDAPATQPAAQSTDQPTTQPAATQPATEQLPRIDTAGMHRLIEQTAAQDRVLVVDYWATWCMSCRAMFGDLHSGLKALGDDVRAVSVTIDEPAKEGEAIDFLKQHDAIKDAHLLIPISDAQMHFAEHIGDEWEGLVVPAILVYDQDGELSAEFMEGGEQAVPGIVAHVESLLNDATSEGSAAMND